MWFFYIFCCSTGAYLLWRKCFKNPSLTKNLESMNEEELRHNLRQLEMEENRQNLFDYDDTIPATIRRIVRHEIPIREDEQTNMKNKLLQNRDPLRYHRNKL
jgi:hypothetical protein